MPVAAAVPVPVQMRVPVTAPAPDAFQRTIQATTRFDPTQRVPAASAARPRDDDYLDTPERSVLLPPKSKSPLRALLAILALGAAAAGAWTTRTQWMPAIGLPVAIAPADAAPPSPAASGAPASAPDAAAAPVAEPASAAVSEPAPAAASQPVSLADDPEASAPAAASAAAAREAQAASAAARVKSERRARAKALEAKIASLKMPPPVLPPPSSSSPPAVANGLRADVPAAGGTAAAPAARGPNWRDACADPEPAKMAACIRRLCDDDAHYQRYPVCQRLRRQEEAQQLRGTPQ